MSPCLTPSGPPAVLAAGWWSCHGRHSAPRTGPQRQALRRAPEQRPSTVRARLSVGAAKADLQAVSQDPSSKRPVHSL